jgi:hypothetical protein
MGEVKPGRFAGRRMTITPPLTGLGQAHHGAILREVAALAESGPKSKAGRLTYCKQAEIKPLTG